MSSAAQRLAELEEILRKGERQRRRARVREACTLLVALAVFSVAIYAAAVL